MPTFRITDPETGRTVKITGDSQPTEEELSRIFSEVSRSPENGSALPSLISGATGFGSTPSSEDVLPLAGQVAGSPFGLPGATAGATAGQALRQGVKFLRGEPVESPVDISTGLAGPIGLRGPIRDEAATTGTIEGAFRGVGSILPKISNRLMASVLKPGAKVLSGKPNIGVDAAREGLVGSEGQIFSKASKLVETASSQLDDIIEKSTSKIELGPIIDNLNDLKRGFSNVGDDASVKAINQVQSGLRRRFKKFGEFGRIPIQQAQQLKRDLFNVIKQSQFGKSEVPAKISARKQVAGQLRKAIEDAIPEEQVGQINKKIGLGIDVRDAIENVTAKETGRNILSPIVESFAIPSSIGARVAVGDVADPVIAGLIGAAILRRVAGSTPVKSGVARMLVNEPLGTGARIGASELSRRLRG